MAMQALRKGASDGILKYFLLGILVLAGGGLVFTDVGGFFRGGVSGNDVVKIGKETVGINTFDRVARRTLQQLGITPAQAYKLGYLDQILASEVRRRTLMRAADDSNILIGQDYVVSQIQKILAPATQNGVSTQQALENLLRGQGITESELTSTILSERTLSLFGDAMKAGALKTPNALALPLYQNDNETRDIRYVSFAHADYKDIDEPSEEQLRELYETTKEINAKPERRTITVATIDTKKLEETLTIGDEELRAEYDEAIDTYITPATRTIEQALFKTEEDATAAATDLSPKDFAKTAKAKKADLIPAKAFEESAILEEIRSAVFGAETTQILTPIETPLGWSIINITDIQEEKTKPFDEVKADIKRDIIDGQIIDEIYKLVDEVDEFFAVGGSLEDAKAQFNITTQTFDNIARGGQNEKGESPLTPALGPDAATILQTGYELEEGTTGQAQELADGSFAVVHVDAITPKSYTPYEEASAQIKTRWINDQRVFGNRTALIALQKENSETSIEEIANTKGKAFKTIKTIKREDEESPLSKVARGSIFNAKPGEHFIIEIKDGVALAEVTTVNKAPAPTDEQLKTIADETQATMQNELLVLYLTKLNEKYPAKVNERLLQQVYGEQSTESY